MSEQYLWLMIALVGGSVFLLRSSFFYLRKHFTMPRWFERALRFVPASVLSALVAPTLLLVDGTPSVTNPRLLAGVVAGLVAWRTRSLLLTIIVGMTLLLVLQRIGF